MQLLPISAAYTRRRQQAAYVERNLRRTRQTDLADALRDASADLRTLGLAWEDARQATFQAQADRDAADADLDDEARGVRARLAGRSATAAREKPYVLIFPKGIDHYTAAPVDRQVTRYRELQERLTAHLPADDDLGAPVVARLGDQLDAYQAAAAQLDAARRAEALALTALRTAEEDFNTLLERTYGALTAKLGKRGAERFFPRLRTGSPRASTPEEPEETEPTDEI